MTISPSLYFIFSHAFILLSMQTILSLGFNLPIEKNSIKCRESDRQALLSLKQGFVDRHRTISSWETQVNNDCCNWKGVQCNNNTGHIIRLDLRGSTSIFLGGKISSSLVLLSHLNYLDLSYNLFDQIFPEFISSLINLNYLNLSHNNFVGAIPLHLGNLSKLSFLDLGFNYGLSINVSDNLGWLSNLSNLIYLDLTYVEFSSTNNNWASVINKLTLLESLFLRHCNLPQPILPSHSRTNFSRFLVDLDLSYNNLNSSIYSWLFNFSDTLIHLDLAVNNLQSSIPDDFEDMTSLVYLDLSSNKLVIRSLKPFRNLYKLKSLSLSDNNVGGLLFDFLEMFPQCLLYSLEYLKLASNKFFGFLPNFTMFPSLKGIDLSNNKLNGTIPQSFGQLSNLEYLYLHQNSLEGEVYEAHFSNLTNLRGLHLSENSLIFKFKFDWIPPFQLRSILLSSCKLGPIFPQWLQTQNFHILDISYTEISDITPDWFWKNLSPNLKFMNLAGNKIKGEIPNFSVKFEELPMIILTSNEFEGQIPPFLLQARMLDLSNNQFSNIACLCEIIDSPLWALDLSDNRLSGQLPNCWGHVSSLVILNLANNNFFGDIPCSMGNLTKLNDLYLRNNQFSGELPSWFNFTNLEVFDAEDNHLFGTIPSWIGSKLPNLVRLNLRLNHFHGSLPSSLCNLKNIQVLDISLNNITGSIPTCIHYFNVLTQRSSTSESYFIPNYKFDFQSWTLFYVEISIRLNQGMVMVWKGQEKFIAKKLLQLERSIDLSYNHLTGTIPNEITELVGLITLNLSCNHLTGQIPDKMGQLHSLESLDLSRNHLLGLIPSSFSQISMLSTLNLSYNNLSGRIPTGTQLQSFNASCYEGNSYLCGAPLKTCFDEGIQNLSINMIPIENKNEDEFIIQELFMSMRIGFVVGFGGILGSLILHRK